MISLQMNMLSGLLAKKFLSSDPNWLASCAVNDNTINKLGNSDQN